MQAPASGALGLAGEVSNPAEQFAGRRSQWQVGAANDRNHRRWNGLRGLDDAELALPSRIVEDLAWQDREHVGQRDDSRQRHEGFADQFATLIARKS